MKKLFIPTLCFGLTTIGQLFSQTWTAQTSGTSNQLFGVHFVDNNNGWTVGQAGTILHTTDGGSNWSPQTSGFGGFLRNVHFVSPTTGWCAGDSGKIFKTTNAGANWNALATGTAS